MERYQPLKEWEKCQDDGKKRERIKKNKKTSLKARDVAGALVNEALADVREYKKVLESIHAITFVSRLWVFFCFHFSPCSLSSTRDLRTVSLT